MAVIYVDVEQRSKYIMLGEQGEKNAVVVKFDISTWLSAFGAGGSAFVDVMRPGDETAYTKQIGLEGNYAVWSVDDIDNAASGKGKVQLTYLMPGDDGRSKTATFVTMVDKSLDASGDVPDPYESYLEEAREIRAETTQNAQTAQAAAQAASTKAGEASTSAADAYASARSAKRSEESAEMSASTASEAAEEILGMTATATTLPEGSEATVDYSNGVMAFGIPRGDKGDKGNKGDTGETGATPQMSIGTVETLAPDEDASVTIRGTAEAPILDFGIPKGETGEVSLLELIANTKVDEVSDSVPYQKRTLSRVGSHESLRKIVGGTVAWNQLSRVSINSPITVNGVTITPNNDGSVTVDGTTTDSGALSGFYLVPEVASHKYLIRISGSAVEQGLSVYTNIGGNWAGFQTVRAATTTAENAPVTLRSNKGITYTNAKAWINTFDLTQMFGSTIADYIYSLEQATAGAGVAWFRKLFPKPYYEYNAGELMSVQASSHDAVGFNQWDEEWELGAIDSRGNNSSSTNSIRTKNYIPVLPNTAYFINTTKFVEIRAYDADKSFIGNCVYAQASGGYIFTTPSTASYIRIPFTYGYGTTYNHDICINLSSPSRNGEYEEYVKHSYPLDNSLTLRGIPKLDSFNNLYYDGDEYESDGTVTRKYGIVDLGTLNWTRQAGSGSQNYRFRGIVSDMSTAAVLHVNCSKYVSDTDPVYDRVKDKVIIGASGALYVEDNAYTDATAFKQAMSGVQLVYELATPTTESATPYTELQEVESGGTEEFVGATIPVGHESVYPRTLADTMPTQDGSYSLSLTISGGKQSVNWEVSQ